VIFYDFFEKGTKNKRCFEAFGVGFGDLPFDVAVGIRRAKHK
jgi:hypothetical protein